MFILKRGTQRKYIPGSDRTGTVLDLLDLGLSWGHSHLSLSKLLSFFFLSNSSSSLRSCQAHAAIMQSPVASRSAAFHWLSSHPKGGSCSSARALARSGKRCAQTPRRCLRRADGRVGDPSVGKHLKRLPEALDAFHLPDGSAAARRRSVRLAVGPQPALGHLALAVSAIQHDRVVDK